MATSSTVSAGDVIQATDYNNLRTDVLSTHDHDGTDGNGTINPNIILFQDQSADPDATGELQRNGNDLKYFDGTSAITISAAPITATANGSNNRIATYSAATALNGEANLTFDGSILVLTGTMTISSTLTMSGNIIMGSNDLTDVGASTNDWTTAGIDTAGYIDLNNGSSVAVLTVETTATDAGAQFLLIVGASSTNNCTIFFNQGSASGAANNMGYQFFYSGADAIFAFRSSDTDGSSTDGNIFEVDDGTTAAGLTWLGTHPTGTHDYVCGSCGRYDTLPFKCCGLVKWHDDLLAIERFISHEPGSMAHLQKLGIIRPDPARHDYIRMGHWNAQWYTWSIQMQQRRQADFDRERTSLVQGWHEYRLGDIDESLMWFGHTTRAHQTMLVEHELMLESDAEKITRLEEKVAVLEEAIV